MSDLILCHEPSTHREAARAPRWHGDGIWAIPSAAGDQRQRQDRPTGSRTGPHWMGRLYMSTPPACMAAHPASEQRRRDADAEAEADLRAYCARNGFDYEHRGSIGIAAFLAPFVDGREVPA